MAVMVVILSATMPAMVRTMMPPLPRMVAPARCDAVVVLGGGRRISGGKQQLNLRTLQRLNKAIDVALDSGLPLLLSGGRSEWRHADKGLSEAALMAAEVSRRAPSLTVISEPNSKNTWENANASAKVLAARGWSRVYLVSDRCHLARASRCFRRCGITAVPCFPQALPTPAWMPSAGALALLPEIWYEWAALAVYAIRWRL